MGVWTRPSIGLFFGLATGSKDNDKKSGHGGLVLGNIVAQIGGLVGGVLGFGEKWGLYTGLMGALALIPFLGFGFVGIPIGIHFKKKFGIGIILPVFMTNWWTGLLVGLGAAAVSLMFYKKA